MDDTDFPYGSRVLHRVVPFPSAPDPRSPDFEARLRLADAIAEREREDAENGPAKMVGGVLMLFCIAIVGGVIGVLWAAFR